MSSNDMTSKDMTSKDMTSKDMTSKDMTSKDLSFNDIQVIWKKAVTSGVVPSARGGHSAVLATAKLVIFGGHYFTGNGNFVYLNETHVLDLETFNWNTVRCSGTPPAPRYGHSATLFGNRMFVFGGRGAQGEHFNDIFYLDINQWQWHSVKPFSIASIAPVSRMSHAHVGFGSKLVIHGGWNSKKSFDDLWIFDVESYIWEHPNVEGKPPSGRHGHSMSIFDVNKVAVFGGYGVTPKEKPEYFGDLRILNMESMLWERITISGAFALPRFGHTANDIGDRLLIIGGWSGGEKSMLCSGEKPRRKKNDKKSIDSSKQGKTSSDTNDHLVFFSSTSTEWIKPSSRGTPITNRYGHTTTSFGSHLILFGGWDGSRALNELFLGEICSSL